ncbi:DNA gyrase subunit B [Streptococcus oralis]|uniref:DNA gyrase subunit B n=1 Tax=Streptococcus oralis TaxID=1303 RepID=A0A139P5G8_STROR|nr:DNA gyrase subunit B [Streptococcus oralis]
MTEEIKNQQAQDYDASQIQVLEGWKLFVCVQVCILGRLQKKAFTI